MQLTRRTLKLKLKLLSADQVQHFDQLATNLLNYMADMGGIGLAANQVGLRDRCFVMRIDGVDWFCANPEIRELGNDLWEFDEGCLSFPGEVCTIVRPNTITVQYQNRLGQWCQQTLHGLAARCFQHELDHLNGITMWDRHKEQNAEQPRN